MAATNTAQPFGLRWTGKSHLQTLLTLAFLTVASGTATRWVAATQPKSLLPWVVAFAIVVAWTFRRPRSVDLFEPLEFLSWTHYAPAFVLGSSLLAVGVVLYPYSSIIADPVGACALTASYIGIGYVALRLGTQWRGARALGARLGRMLPAPRLEPTIPLVAILVLVGIGTAANYGAFRAGIVGFAVPRAPGPLDAAVSYTGLFTALGHFLFWFRWFDPDQKRLPRIALVLPLLIVVSSMVILGNRGALLLSYLHALMAFRFARGRLTMTQGIVAVALAFVALGIGMTYGSVFRHLRGGESGSVAAAAKDAVAAADNEPPAPVASVPAATVPSVPATPAASTPATTVVTSAPATPPPPSLERHLEVAAEAATTLLQNPSSAPWARMIELAGQRLNLISDASVSIVRYPMFRSLEPQYGIVNMWTQTWTSFVPRILWPGKPKVSDGRAYSALYFNYDGNSYATTPPVDLIRNVGPFGMPLGMAVFGAVLGALAVALLASAPAPTGERAALFSLVLVNVNLEGSYGMLLPTMFRVAFVVTLGLVLVRVLSARWARSD